MRIGSTTKHFTCLAYLLLCEAGKADLDDPIGKFLPELHPVNQTVTMRQLMGNIGGLRDVVDMVLQFSGDGPLLTDADLLSCYEKISDTNFLPGVDWAYNNGGFLLLTAVIERGFGQPLETVLRERIFEPVGMFDTALRRHDRELCYNSAATHALDSAGNYRRASFRTPLSGDGGIVSTVDDMLRWLVHMDGPYVGNAYTWYHIKTPLKVAIGSSTGYGLGLMRDSYRGVERIHHAGSVAGGNSQMLKVPSAGLDIVIMLNRRDMLAVQLAEDIIDACLPGLEPRRSEIVVPLVTGVFRSPKTGRVIKFMRARSSTAREPGVGQQLALVDGAEIALEADQSGMLCSVGLTGFIKLRMKVIGDVACPRVIRCIHFGNPDVLVPIAKSDDGRSLVDIEGNYLSQSTGILANVSLGTHGGQLMTSGLLGGSARYDLEPLASGIWRATSGSEIPWGGVLSVDEDGRGFRFSAALRTWALPFRRMP